MVVLPDDERDRDLHFEAVDERANARVVPALIRDELVAECVGRRVGTASAAANEAPLVASDREGRQGVLGDDDTSSVLAPVHRRGESIEEVAETPLIWYKESVSRKLDEERETDLCRSVRLDTRDSKAGPRIALDVPARTESAPYFAKTLRRATHQAPDWWLPVEHHERNGRRFSPTRLVDFELLARLEDLGSFRLGSFWRRLGGPEVRW